MEIIRAEKMGFCFGVKNAINLCNNLIKKKNFLGNIFILGMLVHNKNVTKSMEEKGFITLPEEDLETGKVKLTEKDIIIIRAHGTTKGIYDILEREKVKIYDATCVFVEKIRKTLIESEKNGKKIIFIGDKFHPEVKGIVSFGHDVVVLDSFEELKNFSIDEKAEYTLLTQTTLNKELFFKIKDYVEKNYKNIEIFSKICGATYERQKAVEKLAEITDIVLIVGDKKSSNTKKLYEISKTINNKSYLIEDSSYLKSSWFTNVKKIGITAGASTPEEIILDIEKDIRGTFNDKYGL